MKKVLSIILAAAMLFALMPSAFAEGEGTESITYTFNYGNKGASDTVTGADILTLKPEVDSDGTWRVEGFSWAETPKLTNIRLHWQTRSSHVANDEDGLAEVVAAAVVLTIDKTGTFVPTLTYQPEDYSPINNIYLVKKNEADDVSGAPGNKKNEKLDTYIATKCNEENLIGTVDMYKSERTSGKGDSIEKELDKVNITETGEYYLIFADAGRNENFEALTSKNINYTYTYINSFTLTPAETQEDVISAFALDGSVATAHSASITPLAAALDGSTITASVSADDADGDGVYTVTAPATDESGEYTFLYWIKGLTQDKANKIVSLSPTIEEYKPQNEANYLIAVYEKKNAEAEARAEFYDGNGQLLYTTVEDDIVENDVTVNDGVITIPSLPQMANYETATHWELYGDASNTKYGAGVTTATLSGRMIFVAQYDDVYVKVNGDDVRYGDSITFTADPDTENTYFKWWTRKVGDVTEIVSLDREYTFFPWEDCTVKAVYGDKKQIMAGSLSKIVIDTLGNSAIMAEFIGLDGAEVVEKGIILTNSEETKKIAMSTNASQFTITNNILATTAKGYAIIKDGTAFKEITDGTVTWNQ